MKRLLTWLLSAGLLVVIGLYAVASWYSRPLADDYCYAVIARQQGIVGGALYYYFELTGVYTTTALALLAGKIDPAWNGLTSPILVACLLLLTFKTTVSVAGDEATAVGRNLFAASLLIATLFGCIPAIRESLFWKTGAIPYMGGLVGIQACLSFTFGRRRSKATRRRDAGVSAIIAFFAAGFSQISAVMLVTFFVLAIVATLSRDSAGWFCRPEWRPRLVGGLVGCMIGTLVEIAAPGNAGRMAYFPPPPHLHAIFRFSAEYANHFLAQGFDQHSGILAGLAFVGIWVGAIRKMRETAMGTASERLFGVVRRLLVSVGGAWLILVASFTPAVFGESGPMPARSEVFPWFIVVIEMMWLGWLLGRFVARESRAGGRSRIVAAAALAAIVCVGFWLPGQLMIAESRVRLARAQTTSWDHTNGLIVAAMKAGMQNLDVPLLRRSRGLDLSGDPEGWQNQCEAQYYGLKSIRAVSVPKWGAGH